MNAIALSTRLRVLSAAAASALLLFCTSARADNFEFPFILVGGAYVWPDNSRDVQRGTDFEGGFGYTLAGDWSIEGDGTYSNFNTGKAKGTDFYRSAIDARVTWVPPIPNYRPLNLYLSAGAGLAYNDVADHTQDRTGVFGLFAFGFFTQPIGPYGLRMRFEYRATLDHYDRSPLDQALAVTIVVPLRTK